MWGRYKSAIFEQYLTISQKQCKIGKYARSYYGMLIGTHMRSIEWQYFQWPWVTPKYPKPPNFWYFVSPLKSLISTHYEDIAASASPQITNHPSKGRGHWSGHAHLNLAWQQPYLRNGWSYSSQILHRLCQVPAYWWQITLKGTWSDHVTHFKFWGPNDISGMAYTRIFQFCTQINCIKSLSTDNKPPLKGAWSGHMNHFQFWCPQSYLPKDWSENCPILYAGRMYQILALEWQTTCNGCGQGHITFFLKFGPNHILGIGESIPFKCCVLIDTEVY